MECKQIFARKWFHSALPSVQVICSPGLLAVVGEEVPPSDPHAVRVEEAVAEHGGDGGVNRGAVLS